MSDVTNSKGGTISVTTTAQEILIVPAVTKGQNQEFALTLRVWNTGATDVRVGINEETSTFTVATAGLVPAGEDQYFVSGRKPIVKFIIATESGTSTTKYTAF